MAAAKKAPAKSTATKKDQTTLGDLRAAFEDVTAAVAGIGSQLSTHLSRVTVDQAQSVQVSTGDNVVVLEVEGHDPIVLTRDSAYRLQRDLASAGAAVV